MSQVVSKCEESEKSSSSFVDDQIQLIRKRELADLLRVDPWTIDNWRKAGIIPAPLILSPQVVAWRRSDIVAWLEAREAKPAKTRRPNERVK
jgi:predicted DNA-binding transcriptional regulator AlpA